MHTRMYIYIYIFIHDKFIDIYVLYFVIIYLCIISPTSFTYTQAHIHMFMINVCIYLRALSTLRGLRGIYIAFSKMLRVLWFQ